MPSKLDRCVKAVKAKGTAMNPWAVCKAVLGKTKKKEKRKNKIFSCFPLKFGKKRK